MPASPIAELSQELVDEIVDTLAQLSPRPAHGWWESPQPWVDLNACALVCRSFRARAQVHIFRVIAIKNYRTPKRDHKLSLLQDALEHNPGLVNHIRELELELANSDTGFLWTLHHARLLPILHLVDQARQGFEKLTFRVVGGSSPLSVQDTASEIFRVLGTQITSLSIHFFEDIGQVPPRILAHLPHLTELFPPDFLAYLSFSECTADLSQLRILKARLTSVDDALQVQAVADIAFKSLRELDLTYTFKPDTKNGLLEGSINLERCRSLRRLEITVPFDKGTLSTTLITKNLQSLLSKNDNTLRELRLTLIFSNEVLKKDDVLQAPWPVVGDEIRRIAGAGSLCLYMDYRVERPKDWQTLLGRVLDETYLRSDKDFQSFRYSAADRRSAWTWRFPLP